MWSRDWLTTVHHESCSLVKDRKKQLDEMVLVIVIQMDDLTSRETDLFRQKLDLINLKNCKLSNEAA